MLNDHGKSLFKPWCSVQNVTLGLAALFVIALLIRNYQLNSSEIASWVQAFGSIAAIWGAFVISNNQVKKQEQHRISEELKNKGRLRGILIYLADKHLTKTKLLKDAVQQEYFGSETIRPYLDAKYHLEWPSHLEALKAIDINGLEPLEVGVVIDMQVASQFAIDVCERLDKSWEPAGDREESDIERLRHFRREAKTNFAYLLESASRFNRAS